MQVLIWVQHMLGTGHFKRAATLAEAMAADGLEVTLVSGGPPVDWISPVGVQVEQLPAIRARDRQFSAMVDMDGQPISQVFLAKRRAKLMSVFARTRPRVVLTEMFPFGRRAFRAELTRLLDAAIGFRPRPWILSSVRDILVAKGETQRYDWMRDMVQRHYDHVLVHTDPQLVPFNLTFPHAESIQSKIVTTGYVTEASPDRERRTNMLAPEVLVSTGGGRVGAKLVKTAILARTQSRLKDVPWRIISGGHADPSELEELRSQLPDGMILTGPVKDFQTRLANSLLSISQAGYNTVVEGLRLGKRMVLVPFETATETEQSIRAERLANLGFAETIREMDLTPESLAKAVDSVLDRPPPQVIDIDLDGMANTVRFVRQLVAPEPAARVYS
ncbi:MAG: glycosyltransferase family protein [Geminicoccaceae bacterium]